MKKIFVVVLLLPFYQSFAQSSIRDSSISFTMIGASVAYQMPGGDLAERFGNNYNVGVVFNWKLKSNWIFGLEGDYMFGENVKENHILDIYKTPEGTITDAEGHYSTVLIEQRGLKLDVKGGKIFPIIGPNKNSGLMTTLSAGYLRHMIYIDTPGSPVPYLEGDYRKGYDRLCTGLSLTEFIGYVHFGNTRYINFYAGLEFTQAFTKNRREINFDTGQHDGKQRTDLLFGLRAGWVFPLYKRTAEKIYFN